MQVFELHFNPPHLPTLLKKGETPDLIFDSFCYQPENVYEKRLGSLFLVGELRNLLPQNLKFLDNLALFLKKQYYLSPIKFSPEASLKEGLKKANEFLEGIARAGDVSWLGNLNLAVLSLVPPTTFGQKWWGVNFTKVGIVKILLIRAGQIIDIGKNLEFSEIEPYPLKIFGNIVSGKLAENDIILILTEEIFSAFAEGYGGSAVARLKASRGGDFFQSDSLLQQIANLTLFEEKKLKEILKTKEQELLKNSGICFLCLLTKEAWPGEKKPKALTFQKEAEKFSIAQVFLPLLKMVKRIKFPRILKFPKLPSLKLPKLLFPKFPSLKFKIFPLNKKLILILFLLFFLLVGFLIFKGERAQELKSAQQVLEEVKLKKIQAENFLILKNEKQAAALFQEAWEKILPQTKSGALLKEEALSLKESIEEELFLLNKLEKVTTPDLFFEFKKGEITLLPQKMLSSDSALYFFNPASSKFYKLSVKEKAGEVSETKRNLKLASPFQDSVLFFSNPDVLLFLKEGSWQEMTLQKPGDNFNFDRFSVFKSNIYFLDKKSGEIVKYWLSADQTSPLSPKLWLSPQTKKAIEAKSMAIDGSIWILTPHQKNGGGSIDRYYAGNLQETIELDFFPYPKNLSKIFTSPTLPYLYLLEPEQSRIIILNKAGEIIKQFQSQKFDNLLDFAVSKDGKTIWLLNGLKIYKIEIQ